jgi:cytoskeletal protein CcmA (bactofilin family)
MAKFRVIKEVNFEGLDKLEESVLIKAEIRGDILSAKNIVIKIKEDVSGEITAPSAEVIIGGNFMKTVHITGSITARKISLNNVRIKGDVTAQEVKIRNSKVSREVHASDKFL